MSRGLVLPLTLAQVALRARYLGGQIAANQLDSYVRRPQPKCPDGYYLLKSSNGGKDPTAPDPFDRWTKPDEPVVDIHGNLTGGVIHHDFVNRTADCVGGAAWCGGFDRYQPKRFAHLYDGWINTNSMIEDARGLAKCFVELDRPEPGCFVVCASGSRGHAVGHIGTVITTPPEWDTRVLDCWRHVLIVDVASRSPHPANAVSSAAGWFGTGGGFFRSIMTP